MSFAWGWAAMFAEETNALAVHRQQMQGPRSRFIAHADTSVFFLSFWHVVWIIIPFSPNVSMLPAGHKSLSKEASELM